MIHLSASFSFSLFLTNAWYCVLAHQALLRRVLEPSATAFLNTSQLKSSTRAYDSAPATQSVDTFGNTSSSLVSIPTPLPSPFQSNQNYLDVKAGICAIDDLYCSFKSNISNGNSSNEAFKDQCLLWDTSCSGNRTLAIEEFFNNTIEALIGNQCFSQFDAGVQAGDPGLSIPYVVGGSGPVQLDNIIPSDCKDYNPSERVSEWQDIKSWMRSPSCVSAQSEWMEAGGKATPSNSSGVKESCCEGCVVGAQNVDLYYWPEPDVDTSCLSIVGSSVNPFMYGATTGVLAGALETYWACSAKTPVTSSYSDEFFASSGKITSVYPMVPTAQVTIIGSLTVKVPLLNPWSSSPCIENDITPQDSNSSNSSVNLHVRHAVQARNHTLLNTSSITQESGSSVSTVVMGNFTFTSPSVYGNFYTIEASDTCGQTTISSTMLSFAPGELSTIQGHLAIGYHGWGSSSTKQFNFKDLPCPPQSIMESNWYKPEPGEPYRPLIAMPSQLKQKIPWFSFCEDVFTAYDPPRALRSAAALVPAITSDSDPQTQKPVAAPSHTLDPGARITAASKISTSVPMVAPAAQKTPSPPTDVDPQSNTDPKQGTSIGESGDITGEPRTRADPNVPGLPLQSPAAINSNQDSGQKSNIVGYDTPKPSDNEYPNGNDPGQIVAGDSQTTTSETPTPADPSKDSNCADKGPDQVPQRILTTIAGHAITAAPNAVAIAGATMNPGDTAATIGGTRVALNAAGSLIVDSKTIPLTSSLREPLTTNIAGQAITAHPTAIAIAGTTLNPGDPATTVDGTRILLNTAGSLILGSKTISLPKPLITIIANQPITANPTALTIAGTTIHPGDPAATIGGTKISLNTASSLFLGTKTIPLASTPPTLITTIANEPLTANPTALIVAGTTLHPSDPAISIAGTPISLNAAGNLVIASKTTPLSTVSATPLVTTIAGQVITAAANGIIMAGTTLKVGDAGYPVNGTMISLDTAGHLVVGSKTQSYGIESVGSSGPMTGGPDGPIGHVAGTTTPSSVVVQGGSSKGTGSAATTRVQQFTGEAGGWKGEGLMVKAVLGILGGFELRALLT